MDFQIPPSPECPALVIYAAGVDIVGAQEGGLQLGISNPSKIRTSFGGVARNVVENLARLGVSTATFAPSYPGAVSPD